MFSFAIQERSLHGSYFALRLYNFFCKPGKRKHIKMAVLQCLEIAEMRNQWPFHGCTLTSRRFLTDVLAEPCRRYCSSEHSATSRPSCHTLCKHQTKLTSQTPSQSGPVNRTSFEKQRKSQFHYRYQSWLILNNILTLSSVFSSLQFCI